MSPSKKDMTLLKLGKYLKRLAAILLVSYVAYSCFGMWKKTRSPEWQHEQGKTSSMLTALNKKKESYVRLENLLKDRSKAWVNMELITRLVPDDASVILTKVDHRATSKVVKKSKKSKKAKKAKKRGFQKHWVIEGYMNDKGLDYMSNLSTREGITAVFKEVAVATGNSAYLPDVAKRDLTVVLKQKRNPNAGDLGVSGPEGNLGYSFSLIITQTFSAADELAIIVLPADKKSNKKSKR